jgi:hypothetical protein
MANFMSQDSNARWEFATTALRQFWENNPQHRSELAQGLDHLRGQLHGQIDAASRVAQEENDRLRRRVRNFDKEQSAPYKAFVARGFAKQNLDVLRCISVTIAKAAGLTIDRDSKRRELQLYKWLDEHWIQVGPFLAGIQLCPDGETRDGEPISDSD